MVFHCTILHSQDVSFRHLLPGREVPFSTVYGVMIQDSADYIWAGGPEGLFRFDGDQWKKYPISPGVRDGEALDLQIDAKGEVLWYTSAGGQLCYLPVGGDTISAVSLPPDLANKEIRFFSIVADSVFCTLMEPNGRILNYARYDTKAGTFKIVYTATPGTSLINFFIDANQHWYFSEYSAVSNAQISVKHWQANQHDTILRTFSGDALYSCLFLRPQHSLEKGFWVVSKSPEEVWYVQDQQFKRMRNWPGETVNELYEVHQDNAGNYWFSTDNGMLGFTQDFVPLFDGKRLLSGFTIYNVLQDKEGGFWVGTNGNGVLHLPNLMAEFFTPENAGLPASWITCMEPAPGGGFLAGTNEGQVCYIKDGRIINCVNGGEKAGKTFTVTFIEVHQGQIYVGIANGLNQLRITDNKLSRVDQSPVIPGGNAIALSDAFPEKLLATSFGMLAISPEDNNVIFRRRTSTLLSDQSQSFVWAGGYYGLRKVSIDSAGVFQTSPPLTTFPFFTTDIDQKTDGSIWASTAGQGILVFKDGEIIQRYGQQNGLSTDYCNQLFLDKQENVWVATEQGVNRIDHQDNSVTFFGAPEGILTQQINTVYVDDTDLWAGTNEGLYKIPLTSLPSRPLTAPRVSISGVKIWSQDTILVPRYDLKPRQNNISFRFRSHTYQQQAGLRFRYRMAETDSSWQYTIPGNNEVVFPRLSPGNYRLEVVAETAQGALSPTPATVELNLQAPLWQRTEFLALGVALLLAGNSLISFLVRRSIRRRQQREAQFKQRINALRTTALRLQMNPHFVFNTLNAVFLTILERGREYSLSIVNRFAQLFRFVFESAGKSTIPLKEELEFLEIYLEMEMLRFGDRITTRTDIPETIRQSDILIPPMLIQPLIENAFKHGLFHRTTPGGLFQLQATETEDRIFFKVLDNGIGRQAAAAILAHKKTERSTTSSEILRERIELLNNQIADPKNHVTLTIKDRFTETGMANGTEAILSISKNLYIP